MRKTIGVLAVILAMGCFTLPSHAEQERQGFRIGFLTGNPINLKTGYFGIFVERLRRLGYVEGKNIAIEWRSHGRDRALQKAMAAELVSLKLDAIVANGSGDIRALKKATATNPVPIVMVVGADPVGSGFVKSLARPGGNITGCASVHSELSGKRLEILREIIPRLSRVAVLVTSSSPTFVAGKKELDRRAKLLGVTLRYVDVLRPAGLKTAFRTAVEGSADAIVFLVSGPLTNPHVTEISDLAIKSRLPVIFSREVLVKAGGLMSYGVDRADLFRCAATYVDRILKGAKPADLPVERPTKFNLRVNLKTAKALAIIIPNSVLIRAEEVIE